MILLLLSFLSILALQAEGSFQSEVLDAHNHYREKHGEESMEWDDEVAGFAQQWCDYLAENDKFEHSKDSGYGENIYKSWGSSSSVNAGTRAVDKWYAEEKDYDYDEAKFSMNAGHFTQVRRQLKIFTAARLSGPWQGKGPRSSFKHLSTYNIIQQ